MKELCWLAAPLTLLASNSASAVAPQSGPLAAYVDKEDGSYQWQVRRQGSLGPSSFFELKLISQTWRGIVWKHQLFVIQPSTVSPAAQQALLFITGGSWKEEMERPPRDDQLPGEVIRFGRLAESWKTPVAVLMQVPHQPIFDGKHEDQIIAFTFDKYLQTRDPEWPLLLPMVKSAARAMDAIQELAAQRWSQDIESFTVCGASKRGWTTWLTGAVDPRATALAPMVIDVLDMGRQLEHQESVWGAPSYQIGDYTERGLHQELNSPSGRSLRAIVDPYSYRERLKQPKLIIIGTNDHYWPLDALNLYWDDLIGPKYILYVPNNRHGLSDLDRVTASLTALHRHAIGGAPLPELTWDFSQGDKRLFLEVASDPPPREVRVWVAASATRDFRAAEWVSRPARPASPTYRYELDIPRTGWAALFGEAVYEQDGLSFNLSTNVRVVDGQKASPR